MWGREGAEGWRMITDKAYNCIMDIILNDRMIEQDSEKMRKKKQLKILYSEGEVGWRREDFLLKLTKEEVKQTEIKEIEQMKG